MAKVRAISAGRGPAGGFEDFMRPHFDALYGRAHRLTGNAHDAEDLVQDLCIRAYPRFDELQRIDNPRAWLMRVMYRLFVDLARRQQRSPLRSLSETEADDSSEAMTSQSPSPEEDVDAILAGGRLEQAWRHLDREQQVLLVLHGVEGFSLAELQEITGHPEGTLKSRLHRARIKLGRLMRREENVVRLSLRGLSDEMPRHRESVG